MGKVRRCLLSAVLVTMLCGPSAGGGERPAEQQAPWKVGLAAAKVTPRKPVYLSGYASRNHPFESVEADLYVKAMALEDEAGHRAVLVTADIIGFRIEMSRRIWTGVKKTTGLEPHQVLLCVPHAYGPIGFARSHSDGPQPDGTAGARYRRVHELAD
ncbi:MAG: hypothetical protein GXP27_21150 [Planctomycetes bacterium]|nr:hypothetical protein [Planctomycetota bacterium]